MGILSNTLDSNAYSPNLVNDRNMILNSGMEIYELKDVINGDFITGSTPNYSENIIENGAVLLKTVNIYSNYLDDSKLFYISNSVHENRLKRSQLKKGDIILTVIGATDEVVGRAVVYNGYPEKANITQSLCKFGINQKYDNYYISTFINCKYGHSMILQMAASSTRRYINNADLGTLLIPIPSPEIQKYIGDKVRKAEELREEAKTLQKEIDILLEVDMLLKEETDKVYNIYDSKINWTNEINIEDRIDPNFYQKKYISTIEKLGNNKVRLEKYVRITKIRYQTGNINKYIEISSINNSFGTIDEVEELRPEEIPTSAKYQVKEGDILVSLVRPTRKAISIVTKEYDNAICTGGFAVLQSKGKVPVEFLTAVLRTNFVGIQFERYCAGSTYPTINEDDVVKVFIPMYSENQINKITENYRRIIDNIYTSKKLIQEAKRDVEDLIEGNFDMSKVKANS